MVLSQTDIKKSIETGEIAFSPDLEPDQFGEASIDLRLGFSFTKLRSVPGVKLSVASGLGALSLSGFWNTIELKEKDDHGHQQSYALSPGEFVLCMTHESITVPPNLIALVEGRSTYARVGLSMHQTAPWIQPGWEGPIVLEIMNNGPLQIELTPLIDRPCQLTFFELKTACDIAARYGSRPTDVYQKQAHPLTPKKKN